MTKDELVRRVQVYAETGMTPEQVAERIWDFLLGPAITTAKQHGSLLHTLRLAGEKDEYIRNAFRDMYLDNFGFVPGEYEVLEEVDADL